MIYLDNAATTQMLPEVVDAMMPYMTEIYGNPGSIHIAGRQAAEAVEKARRQVAAPIGVDPGNIIFTSGGSEANALVFRGIADHLKAQNKTHILVSNVEHSSVLECAKWMFHNGFDVEYLPVNLDGSLPPDRVERAIRDDTGLVSVMAVNNEIGNWYDVGSIAERCKKRDVLFHSDFVQSYGSSMVNVASTGMIDFITASAHKIHGPKGVGFLCAKNKWLLKPQILGHQERGLRAGTENVPGVVGFGAAAEVISSRKDYDTIYDLRIRFLTELTRRTYGVKVNGDGFCYSKILSIQIDDVDAETLILLLSSRGVMVSAGSACTANKAEPSHVLKAIGLSDKDARSSIRVSFSEQQTLDEICEAAKVIAEAIDFLRNQ